MSKAAAISLGHRRQALWQAVARAADKELLWTMPVPEDEIQLEAPSKAEEIVGDYRFLGLTPGRNPVALLRPILAKLRFLPAEVWNAFSDRQIARGCGIVTVRQRLETAKGVMVLTLEDETGLVNVKVWPALIGKHRKELLNACLPFITYRWHPRRAALVVHGVTMNSPTVFNVSTGQ